MLSNPAAAPGAEKDKPTAAPADGEAAAAARKVGPAGAGQVQAHPIVGWKGFDDVVASLPGETVDIVQSAPVGVDAGVAAMREWRSRCIPV